MQDIKNVVFFDGVCGLCNSSVDFLIKIDKKNILIFSPLQSYFAVKVLAKFNIQLNLEQLDTIIYLGSNSNKIYVKSNAVLEILKDLKNVWSVFYIFKIIPTQLRDILYEYISKNRYNILGAKFKKKESCRIPTPEERKRFIL
jgi:predicted DCC family thiol-disulfide oxidoreductase YuxK